MLEEFTFRIVLFSMKFEVFCIQLIEEFLGGHHLLPSLQVFP